jgi:hypothetical protein
MPDMPLEARLASIEHTYASLVTDPRVYRNNTPMGALAFIQRAQDARERAIVQAWVDHICAS